MRRLYLLIFLLFFLFFSLHSIDSSYDPSKSKLGTSISAFVGQRYLNVCGYSSPHSTVTLTSKEGILRTINANSKGYFYISNILVKSDLTKVCFQAIDRERLGESDSCLKVSIKEENTFIKNVLLPPTIGIKDKLLKEGKESLTYGYTMPGAKVSLKVNGKAYSDMSADGFGYYKFLEKNLKSGTYVMSAKANYSYIESLDPTNSVILRVLSIWEQLKRIITDVGSWIPQLLFSSLGFSIFMFILLLLILILLYKIYREKRDRNED